MANKFKVECAACGESYGFEQDPREWDSHPSTDLRVKIECPECGATQYTDGMEEHEFAAARNRAIIEEAMRAAQAKYGDTIAVAARDSGEAGDRAAAG